MQHAISKLYYSIAEAANIIGEEQHVLRYWEREFAQLRPQKNRAGNRTYTKRDIAVLRVIKTLLRDERYTVAGAKEYLRLHGLPQEAELGKAGTGATVVAEHVETQERVPLGIDMQEAQRVVAELRAIALQLRSGVAV